MEINIFEHLSQDKMNEIVEEEFRKVVRERLNSEKEITRIIGNSAYHKAFGILDNALPEDWKETVVKKVSEVVNDAERYNIFRYNWSTNKPESLASNLIESTVEQNKDRIVEMINALIDDRLNKDSENKDLFVDRLIDSFYNTFTVKFERQ